MTDRSFVVLKLPRQGSCDGVVCQVPAQVPYPQLLFYRDPFGAPEYLLRKYDLHDCPGRLSRAADGKGANIKASSFITVCCLGVIGWDLCTGKAFDADRQGDFPSLPLIEKRAVAIFQ
jgi:hypothetical protein